MLSLLVAYSKNRVTGAQGKIPWKLSSERNRFKQLCSGKKIIMGRKTFEEIGHALPYCTIVIVSKSLNTQPSGCILADSLEKAIELCKKQNSNPEEEVLVAGGSQIYEQTLPLADRIYATEIDLTLKGDCFFPELEEKDWSKSVEKECSENNINFTYVTFSRIKTQI